MKLFFKYSDPKKAYSIAEKIISTTSIVAKKTFPDIPESSLSQLTDVANASIRASLDAIVEDATELVISYDLTEGISNTFEIFTKEFKNVDTRD